VATEADVVVAWGHGSVPQAVKPAFLRPTRFVTLPNPQSWKEALAEAGGSLHALLAKYASDVEPLRVAALGFSASCQGVAQILAGPDGRDLEAAIAVDGLHVGLPIAPLAMRPWVNFAALAYQNEKLLVVTHSSIVPPGYASTTQTADYLWKTLVGDEVGTLPDVPDLSIPPTSVHVSAGPATGPDRTVQYPAPPAQPPKRAYGLVVLGYDNLDVPRGTADHVYQAKAVLPMVLAQFLAKRWNAIDPKDPAAACFTG
jgi:hypothetical protein